MVLYRLYLQMARLEGFVWESKTNMDSKSCQKLGGDVFRIVPRRLFSQREKETWEYHTLTLNLFILEDIFLTFQHPQKRWSWIYPIPVVWFMIRDLPNTGGIGCAGDEPTRTPGVTPKFYHPKTTPTTWPQRKHEAFWNIAVMRKRTMDVTSHRTITEMM